MPRPNVVPSLLLVRVWMVVSVLAALVVGVLVWQVASAVDVGCPPDPDPSSYAPGEITLGACNQQRESFNALANQSAQEVKPTRIVQQISWAMDRLECGESRLLICRGDTVCTLATDVNTLVACDRNGCLCGGGPNPTACGTYHGSKPNDFDTGTFTDDGVSNYKLVTVQNVTQCSVDLVASHAVYVKAYAGQDPMDDVCTRASVQAIGPSNAWTTYQFEFNGDVDWQKVVVPNNGTLAIRVSPPGAPDPPEEDIQFSLWQGPASAACNGSTTTVNTGEGGYPEMQQLRVAAGDEVRFGISAPLGDWTGKYTFRLRYVPDAVPEAVPPVFTRIGSGVSTDSNDAKYFQVLVQDSGSGLKSLIPQRDPYCATCIPALDGEDCAGTPPLVCNGQNAANCNRTPPPICTVVRWTPFTPATTEPVTITVSSGPQARQDPNWYFGAHIDAFDFNDNTSFYQEFRDLFAPVCLIEKLEPTVLGQERYQYWIRDTGNEMSGLASIKVTERSNVILTPEPNADGFITAFTPGTQEPVIVVETQAIPGFSATSALLVTDKDGNTTDCDPQIVSQPLFLPSIQK